MMLSMVVVLPAPLRPTRQTTSWLRTLNETPCRMCAGPRQAWMFFTSSMVRCRSRADTWPRRCFGGSPRDRRLTMLGGQNIHAFRGPAHILNQVSRSEDGRVGQESRFGGTTNHSKQDNAHILHGVSK